MYLHSPPTTLNDIQIDSIRKVINEEISDCRVKKFGVSLKSPSDYLTISEMFPEATWYQFNYNQLIKDSLILDFLKLPHEIIILW